MIDKEIEDKIWEILGAARNLGLLCIIGCGYERRQLSIASLTSVFISTRGIALVILRRANELQCTMHKSERR